jgi:hypothetical protein
MEIQGRLLSCLLVFHHLAIPTETPAGARQRSHQSMAQSTTEDTLESLWRRYTVCT